MTTALAQRIVIAPEIAAWREKARELLRDGVAPESVELTSEPETTGALFALDAPPAGNPTLGIVKPAVPKAFLELAATVACHNSAERWQLLNRVLWRLQMHRGLMQNELEPDIAAMHRMDRQVRRDLHKMHAFVRFRMIETEGREHYIAWYRPEHHVLALAAPFFAERFAVMHWTILTEEASVSWSPETRELAWGPGVPRSAAPAGDALETLWRSYYGSIFNPARLNTRAMKAEMPVRYWRTLPEVDLLPTLLQNADTRVDTMIEQQSALTRNSFVPQQHTLPVLREALPRCEGCDLFRHATQAVFGAGMAHAPLMLVGEQPGNEEDLQGRPFVGPAGHVLDEIVAELGLDRGGMYVTNAVKHFKFVERGKRRIHESPKMREINACRPWLLAELDAVRPRVVLCLGASAAKSLLGAKFALMKDRGKVVESPYAQRVIATVHPSAVLRAEGESKQTLYTFIRQDLALAAELAQREG